MEVIDFFQLSNKSADKIRDEVLANINNWKMVATKIGLNRIEQQSMAPAFNVYILNCGTSPNIAANIAVKYAIEVSALDAAEKTKI